MKNKSFFEAFHFRNIFARATAGSTIIEFAIVAPLLFLMLIGTIEISMILFTYSVLEGATNVGSRIGKTGYTTNGTAREAYIRHQIQVLSGGFLDPNILQIDILSYNSFDDIGQPEPCTTPGDTAPCPLGYIDVNHNGQWDADQGITGAGNKGAIVLYKVTYPWRLFTPMMRNLFGNKNGVYNISAISTVRNEQFQ